jgi:hypothetical protein
MIGALCVFGVWRVPRHNAVGDLFPCAAVRVVRQGGEPIGALRTRTRPIQRHPICEGDFTPSRRGRNRLVVLVGALPHERPMPIKEQPSQGEHKERRHNHSGVAEQRFKRHMSLLHGHQRAPIIRPW